MKKVLITGVTGQDGSLMVDYLLANTDHLLIGGIRRLSVKNHKNIEHLVGNPRFKLIDLDVMDSQNTEAVIREEKPDYFINFAANSFVGSSWKMPISHMKTNCLAVLYQLEAIRKFAPHCRYYNAGSSEEFGKVEYSPQDEKHPPCPMSPYAASKVSARQIVRVWRESYHLYAVQGWLFNHEGVRRGEEFVTRKITKAVARIRKEAQNGDPISPIELGNLDSKRDWSDAEDFVDGIWKMLNQDIYNLDLGTQINYGFNGNFHTDGFASKQKETQARTWLSKKIKDYVLASGETHSIREFVELSFRAAGYHYTNWHRPTSDPVQEVLLLDLYQNGNEQVAVKINPAFYRPAEVDILLGDSSLARQELKWKPKVSFNELVTKMVLHDIKENCS